jgi:hypothetical protein
MVVITKESTVQYILRSGARIWFGETLIIFGDKIL